ncbi:MAG TPA: transposase [Paraburkholderia sp.]|jgi:transposase|nr:transposase [Paraburkholderia sp.]
MASRNRQSPTVERRRKAGTMLLNGVPLAEVADKLHLSMTTVRKYQRLVGEGGIEALEGLSVGGRVSVLDAQAMTWIAEALAGSAREHGFDSDAWTSTRLSELIRQRFGVTFSRVYTWQLATNLGLGHRLTKSRR